MEVVSILIACAAFLMGLLSLLSFILPAILKTRFVESNTTFIILLGFAAVVLFWYVLVFLNKENSDSYAEIYTTLFSALGFAGLIATLYLQIVLRFENVFFQMLQSHQELVRSLDFVRKNGKTTVGRDVFRTYYRHLMGRVIKIAGSKNLTLQRFDEGDKTMQVGYIDISIDEMVACYEKLFDRRESDLGVFFRSLYHIFKYVDEAPIMDKRRYTRIIRSQLSTFELVFLFYNGLSEYGEPFKDKYLEKYKVLHNMNWRHIFNYEHLLEYQHLRDDYVEYKKKLMVKFP